MMNLPVNHPNIRAEVRAGKIVVYKTSSKCSAMASDQCHEQDNGAAKVVGLTEHPSTLRQAIKWQDGFQNVKRMGRLEDHESN